MDTTILLGSPFFFPRRYRLQLLTWRRGEEEEEERRRHRNSEENASVNMQFSF